MSTHQKFVSSVVIVLGFAICADHCWGQCSSAQSGARGLTPSALAAGSPQSTYNLAALNFPSAYGTFAYSPQRQLQMVQQQLALAQQRRRYQQTSLNQQSLLAIRRERAERTRQFRAERIARAMARREAEAPNSSAPSSFESSNTQVLVSTGKNFE